MVGISNSRTYLTSTILPKKQGIITMVYIWPRWRMVFSPFFLPYLCVSLSATMDKNIDNSSISADGSIDNSVIAVGESFNNDSPDRGACNTPLETESMDTRKPADSGKVVIFETWGQLLVMVPFTIAITLFGASWANERRYFDPAFFPNSQTFFLITTLNFYISIIGIIVSRVSPTFARGFHFIAFLCALVSLTMLFEALLRNGLSAVPWIFLALVISILCGLVIYEWYFMPIEHNPIGKNEEEVAPNGS